MKILRTIGVLALVAGLVLGGVSSAFAQDGPPGKRHGFFGTVTSVDEGVVTLVTKEGSTVEVTLPLAAKYMIPGETKGPVNLDGFEAALGEPITTIEGRRVAVLATNVAGEPSGPFSGDLVRLMLMPSPSSPPLHAHRVGVVETFVAGENGENGSIEIIDRHGVSHPFTVSEDTVYRPYTITYEDITDAESFVTVVTTGDPKLGTAIAKAIVLHEGLPDWAPEP